MKKNAQEFYPYFWDEIQTPLGILTLLGNESFLVKIFFPEEKEIEFWKSSCEFLETSPTKKFKEEVLSYMKGDLREFKTPYLLLGSDFQKEVWKNLQQIPYGKTMSYEEFAILFFKTRSYTRAISSCMGKNPLPIIYPCHRVIGKNGNMKGFAGGTQIKKSLITMELLHSKN